MQLTLAISNTVTSRTLVPGSGKTSNFEKYPYDPVRKWDDLAKQGTDVYRVQNYPILEECMNIQKGELKRGGENVHFDASDPSVNINDEGFHQLGQRLLYCLRNMWLPWKDF